jgi:hypothetical protein
VKIYGVLVPLSAALGMNIVSDAMSAGLNVGRLPPIDFVQSIEITQVLSISCACLHVVSLTPDKMDSSLVSPIECICLLSVGKYSVRYFPCRDETRHQQPLP